MTRFDPSAPGGDLPAGPAEPGHADERKSSVALGDYLRLARELRGLSLAHVSTTTRVRESWLADIERGDLDDLPAEVFVRGFVRAYARAVGADPDHANRLLSALLRERARLAEPPRSPWTSVTSAPARSHGARDRSRTEDQTLLVRPLAHPLAHADDDADRAAGAPEFPYYGDGRMRAGVALAVIVLLIAATVAVSMLLRRPVPPADSISSAPPAALSAPDARA